VSKVGIQNQHVTGQSRGAYNPEFRNKLEARMLGQEVVHYERLDPEVKPKYGQLRPSRSSGLSTKELPERFPEERFPEEIYGPMTYGDDIYVLEIDHI